MRSVERLPTVGAGEHREQVGRELQLAAPHERDAVVLIHGYDLLSQPRILRQQRGYVGTGGGDELGVLLPRCHPGAHRANIYRMRL